MRENFEPALAETLAHEGGWADDPQDPGGATMKGVTLATFRAYKGRSVTKAELRNISDADLRAIYRGRYWNAVHGDDLPPGVDLVTFDAGVNSGPARGVRWLQEALGVAADGKIGPKSLQAAAKADPIAVIHAACDARVQFLRGLPHYPRFGKGWERRVASVRAKALSMVHSRPAPPVQTQTVAQNLTATAIIVALIIAAVAILS